MKILLLVYSLDPGGTERQFVNMAKAFSGQAIDVHVATFYPGGRLEQELSEADNLKITNLNKSGRWDFAKFGWVTRNYIQTHRFDIVYSFLSGPNLVALLARSLTKRPKIVWGVRASPLDYSQYEQTTRWVERIERLLSPFADQIIGNSRAGLNDWSKSGVPKAKLAYIPNGIRTERFSPDSRFYESVRHELGLPASTTLIGLVGRCEPRKDHKTFLKAASILKTQDEKIRFICIGRTGIYRENYATELKQYSAQLGLESFVHWLGDRTDVPRLMGALDILTSSSAFGEGFPNVVAEGMACGTPCVVTDVGDSSDIVGDCGLVVPPKNPAALAKAWQHILAMTKTQRDVMGRRSRERIEQNYSVERMVERTLEILKNL